MNTNEVPATPEVTENGRDARSTTEEANRRHACSTPETTETSPAPLSVNKLAANRRNACKSTGPRTAEGKEASRMNAVRHGILSTAVVVRGLRIREHEEEFKTLREQCWECFAPVGRMEEALVDKIVTAQWRMRRALIAETGEIVKSVDGNRWKRSKKDPISLMTLKYPTGDTSEKMTKSVQGLEYLRFTLEKVREGMRADGELTEKTLDWVRGRFMNQPNAVTRELEAYRAAYLANSSAVAAGAMADREGLSPEELRERHQTAVERYVEATLGWQAELSVDRKEREDKEETAQQAADVLPSSEVLEKIMRYEGALDRQMYRAMNQLERLQRRRGGEKLAAPLMMDVMK